MVSFFIVPCVCIYILYNIYLFERILTILLVKWSINSNNLFNDFTESNERLQVHLKERMNALEEKNSLQQELERTRKITEDLQNEKADLVKELGKARLEIDSMKRQMLQQEIAFNIQQTDALTRSLSPSAVDSVAFSRSASHGSFETHSLPRRGRRTVDEESSKVFELLLANFKLFRIFF